MPRRSPSILALPLAMLMGGALVTGFAPGQFGGLKKPSLGDLAGKAVNPMLDSIFKKGPAITTSIKDAKFGDPNRDGFSPEAKDLFSLDRTPEGGFVLKAGAWGAAVQSYCLHAGTYAPTSGDGYLDAPVKGPYERLVTNVARRSSAHPEIQQHDVQLLLWALIARAKPSELTGSVRTAANALMTQQERFDADGGALGILSDEKITGAFGGQPPVLARAFEAEARLRQAFASSGNYDQFERIAVLASDAEAKRGPGSREVPSGRWSVRPEGYWVRYIPNGYSETRCEVWVPEGSKAIGAAFDPAEHIAAPGDTARQRLIQSGRARR